jgi:hypothetical protein
MHPIVKASGRSVKSDKAQSTTDSSQSIEGQLIQSGMRGTLLTSYDSAFALEAWPLLLPLKQLSVKTP